MSGSGHGEKNSRRAYVFRITPESCRKASLAALTLSAIPGLNNIFRDGQRHGYSESAIGDDARTIRARMPSFKKT